jgi:polysaccharide deacetylase family protein (PEP-CTERM system associated)
MSIAAGPSDKHAAGGELAAVGDAQPPSAAPDAAAATPRCGGLGAMTIDVEDYYQVEAFASTIDREDWPNLPPRVERNTHRLLDILAAAEARATFFMLGCIARRHPALAHRIVAEGHELASHGRDHDRVDRLTPAAFRADIRESKKILEDAGGIAIRGYRAPTFSIGSGSLWAHAILAEEGYCYSSSVYPVRHDLYGSPGAPGSAFAPCPGMIEVPLTTVPLFGIDVPASGGGYFRLFPYPLSRWLLNRAVGCAAERPAIFYLHPWEIDPEQPRQRQAPWRSRFRHYLNLGRTEARLRQLLGHFAWTRMDRLFLDKSEPFPLITAWTDHRPRSR